MLLVGVLCPRLDSFDPSQSTAAADLFRRKEEEINMKVSKDFILREIAGEYILVPTGASAAKINGLITMNELGCFIFKTLTESQTMETLVDAIVAEYDVDRNTAQADAQEFLTQLDEIGGLEQADD